MTLRHSGIAVALATVGAPLAWALWVAPDLTALPDDFAYRADIFSRDDFFEAEQGQFGGERLSHTEFEYEVVGRDGEVLTIRNAVDVRTPSGELIFAVERLYAVDRRTARHVPGSGDRDREGYLFGPPGGGREPFTYWHVNYDAPARMEFQGEEELFGLNVHRFAADLAADQTASLGHLPGVPERRGVALDVHLELWIEPASGWLVQYEDASTAYYYDVGSRERLHPWNRFSNRYTEASVAAQVRRAKVARARALWAGTRGIIAAALIGALLALAAVGVGRRGATGVFAAFAPGLSSLHRRVPAVAALLVAALGIAVVAGWVLGLPRLVQVHPDLVPMQFNTALGFCMCAGALWAYVTGRARLARAVSFAVALLGALTLLQYALHVDIGLDELLMPATITVQTSHPGRMAPATAAAFVLVGAALLVGVQPRGAPAVGALGALVASLGLAALLGYGLGLPEAYRLGRWTSMAAHTAAGFAVLGAALVAASWPRPESATGPRRLAAYAGIGGLAALVVLYNALLAREDQHVARLVSLEADRAASRMSDSIGERVRALRRMAARWSSSGGTARQEWERDAAGYAEALSGVQAIEWVDASARVRWIVPLPGNESALGLDLASEPNRRQALAHARGTGGVGVSRPIDLAQGGRGFLICLPIVLRDGRFDGYMVGVFRYDVLIEVLIRQIATQGHGVQLHDGSELVYQYGPDRPERVAVQMRKVGGAAERWRLTLWPRPEWASWRRSSLPEVTLGAGLAVLALTALGLALAWDAGRRAVLLQREIELGSRREARLRDFLEGAPDAVVMSNAAGEIALVNAQALEMFGYERDELLGQPVEVLVPDRHKGAHPGLRDGYFASPRTRGMGVGRELTARRRDGTEFPVEISLSPLEEGSLTMSAIRDVTERRDAARALAAQAQELARQRTAAMNLARDAEEARREADRARDRITESLREKEILLQEVHHRVKNNLQVISSLINMQVRQLPDDASRQPLEECRARVQAIALIHETLYQSKDFAQVPFSAYARNLAASVFEVADVSQARVSLRFDCDDVALPVDRAIPCGLILNELITNALKHAFPGGRSGSIDVRVRRDGERALVLAVSDDGIGIPAGRDVRTSKSLGLQLVRLLAKQVGGELAVAGGAGAVFELRIPLEA